MEDKRRRLAEIQEELRKEGVTEERAAELVAEARRISVEMLIASTPAPAAAAANDNKRAQALVDFVRNSNNGASIELRAAMKMADVANATPIDVKPIIEVAQKALVLDKLGIQMQTGVLGKVVYPIAAEVEATIEGETVALADSQVVITKKEPTKHRVGLNIPVSNQALDNAPEFYNYCVNALGKGVALLLNKALCSKTAVGTTNPISGPFVAPGATMTYTGAPTYAQIIELASKPAQADVPDLGRKAYLVSPSMLAKLKSTPKDAGSGRFICEDGYIDGVPVLETSYVAADDILFGYFDYLLPIQFGSMRVTIDKVTGAIQDVTKFIINSDFDELSLNADAFAVLTKA